MQYSADWTIDSSDADFDLNSYFTLDSPSDGGFVTFFVFNKDIDQKIHVNKQVKAHLSKTMENGEVSYINNWGSYSGYGAVIKGKVSGIFKGVLTIFAYSKHNISFLVISQILNADKIVDEPGLKLIESTFKLTE